MFLGWCSTVWWRYNFHQFSILYWTALPNANVQGGHSREFTTFTGMAGQEQRSKCISIHYNILIVWRENGSSPIDIHVLIWRFPKMEVPSNSQFVYGILHYKPSIWGSNPIYGNLHTYIYIYIDLYIYIFRFICI